MNFQNLTKWQGGGGKLSALKQMAQSRTHLPLLRAFGAALKELHARYDQQRGQKFSHAALAQHVTARLQKLGSALSISGPTLHRWEAGQAWNPSPLALRELAGLYGITFSTLAGVLFKNCEQPNLTDQDGLRLLVEAAQHERLPEDSTDTQRPWLLTGQNAVSVVARLITASEDLAALADSILHTTTGGQIATPRDSSTTRDAHHRKTR